MFKLESGEWPTDKQRVARNMVD
jgi:Ubiquitin carboxyl-terminal hydrolase